MSLRLFAQISHICLIIWVILWHSWLAPSPLLSQTFMLGLWLPMLLLPLPALLRGRLYTFRWINFCLIPYMLHSTTLLVTQTVPWWLATGELALTLLAFSANLWVVYAARQTAATPSTSAL